MSKQKNRLFFIEFRPYILVLLEFMIKSMLFTIPNQVNLPEILEDIRSIAYSIEDLSLKTQQNQGTIQYF